MVPNFLIYFFVMQYDETDIPPPNLSPPLPLPPPPPRIDPHAPPPPPTLPLQTLRPDNAYLAHFKSFLDGAIERGMTRHKQIKEQIRETEQNIDLHGKNLKAFKDDLTDIENYITGLTDILETFF
jgi:hypothetical protein